MQNDEKFTLRGCGDLFDRLVVGGFCMERNGLDSYFDCDRRHSIAFRHY
jgi:hypothetical protein